jgi:hypothetical protein
LAEEYGQDEVLGLFFVDIGDSYLAKESSNVKSKAKWTNDINTNGVAAAVEEDLQYKLTLNHRGSSAEKI